MQRDRGQTTLEWLGIAAVVVALVAALVAAASNLSAPAQTTFEDTACELVGDDCGEGGNEDQAGDDGDQGGGEDGDRGGGDDGDDDDGDDGGGILGDIAGGLGDIVGGIGDAGGAVLDGLGTASGAVLDGGSALLNGLILGDYGDGYDNPILEGLRIAGQTASGILIVGDIRDGVRAIQTGDEVSLGLIVIGLIPVYGDGIRAAGNVGDSVVDATRRADDVVDGSTDAARGADDAADAAGGSRQPDLRCSFGSDVPVLLADGRAIPIAEIDVGDVVVAEDPATGERGPRAVTRVWLHDDYLVDLYTAAGTITTTADHPFWSHVAQDWVAASDLVPSDRLRTAEGELVPVVGLDPASARIGPAHNLSVEGVNTYFVRAGATDVLVHNQDTCDLVPGGGLQVHEDLGGHTLERHVGRSDESLLQRLADDQGISASSSFPDREAAERIISDTMARNQADIDAFANGSGGPVLVLNESFPTPTGRSVARGSTDVQDVNGVRIVLRRDPSSPTGYRVQTAFPQP